MERIYSDDLWDRFVAKIENNYKSKTYPQLDPIFHFPSQKDRIKKILVDETYSNFKGHSFAPLLKVLKKTPRLRYQEDEAIKDLETKIRPISFASHFDSYIYSFYAFALNELYQESIKTDGFNDVVLAYRSDLNGKCNIQFAKDVFDEVDIMTKTKGSCSAIALDIKGYFDNINHEILKKEWYGLLQLNHLPYDHFKIFKSLTQYSYINLDSFLKHFNINLKLIDKKYKNEIKKGKLIDRPYNSILDLIPQEFKLNNYNSKLKYLRESNLITKNREKDKNNVWQIKKKGIPQGSPLSSVLSNIYLYNFDKLIYKLSLEEDFVYRRYCDDLLIICDTVQVNSLKNYLMNLIYEKYGLQIQDKKTKVVDFAPFKDKSIRSFNRNYNTLTKEFEISNGEESSISYLQYLGFEYDGKNIRVRASSLSRYFIKMKKKIFRTVAMRYGKNSKSTHIYKKELYKRYTHFGNQNFISYCKRAASVSYINSNGIEKFGMASPAIRKQLASHIRIMSEELNKEEAFFRDKKTNNN